MFNSISDTEITRRTLLIIFVLAVFLRLLNLMMVNDVALHALIEDSPIYWKGAAYWLETGFFSVPSGDGFKPNTERVPLYHLFLIPFRWLFGDAIMPVLVIQSVIDAGTCVVIAMLGAKIDRTTGIVAGLFAAAWYNLILHSSLVLTDTVFAFLMSLVLLNATEFLEKRRLFHAAMVGLICGLAIMTRVAALYLPLAIAVAAPLITRYVGKGWRPGILAGLVVIILSALPTTPIVYRNLTQFGTVQLTSQSGVFLLNWAVGISKSLSSGRGFDEVSNELNIKLEERIARLEDPRKKLTAFDYSNHRLALAWEEIMEMPVRALLFGWAYGAANNLAAPTVAIDPRVRSLNRKSFFNAQGNNLIERSIDFLTGNDSRYVVLLCAGIIGAIVSLALQVYGWCLLISRMPWVALFGTLAILYFLLANGPVGNPKYRLPFEPVLIVFQAVAIVDLARRFMRFHHREKQTI